MVGNRAVHMRAFATLILVVAACVAALFAHIGIDLAGDVVLAHDTYDGLDHRSRSEIIVVALAVAFGGLVRLVWLAFDDVRSGRPSARPAFDDLFGRENWRFIVAVVALAVPALMTMELLDIIADGRAFDDLTDLLGGSVWLALCITLPIAALVAMTVRSIADFVMRSHRVLVAVIGRLLEFRMVWQPLIGANVGARVLRFPIRRRSILSRRSGKRGPPVLIG